MNVEVQEMETYQLFVVLIFNAKVTEEIEFCPRAIIPKYESREYLDDKEAPNYSVAPRYKI